MATLEIREFICRADNYGVLLHDKEADVTAAIDAPDEAAIRKELHAQGWRLTHIFTTHHHGDHTAGHAGLKRETGCVVYGPAKEAALIPAIDVTVKEGDRLVFGAFEVEVLETPGHTLGHVAFHLPGARQGSGEHGAAFVGDTLFSAGCGRVIEGTHAMMWNSLQKLMALPKATLIYCGHEYTRANIAFALTVEPENEALLARKGEVERLLGEGKFTLPVMLAEELKTNPFLRVNSPEIRRHCWADATASGEKVFETLRRAKDRF